MGSSTAGGGSPAQKIYYLTVLVPMWRGQLDRLTAAQREYRWHLLAMECLRLARGPGIDPLRITEFCRAWQIPLTAPMVGPVALLRKAAKAVGGWPSPGAVFDPTGAINLGIKILAHMTPLVGQIQMRNALLMAMDEDVVARSDQSGVLGILNAAKSPQLLLNQVAASKTALERTWEDTKKFAERMKTAQTDLGLPDIAM